MLQGEHSAILLSFTKLPFVIKVIFVIHVSCLSYHVFLFVHCSLVVTCWEGADILALLYVMFYCVTFPCGVLGQVCCLIISIPDLCPFPTLFIFEWPFYAGFTVLRR